ncbi:MAG: CinA family protein, partial [Casimicrobiaceae bacterium]
LDAAAHLGARLAARGWSASTAESCTGGLVAAALTAVAGSSAWFERGFVTYSNVAKEEMLGVPTALIAAHGAVSQATAAAMVTGAIARSRADVAVAVTGVAGPGGGTADKPVGTVCFAWVRREGAPVVATRYFPGDRAAVRAASVTVALEGLLGLTEES